MNHCLARNLHLKVLNMIPLTEWKILIEFLYLIIKFSKANFKHVNLIFYVSIALRLINCL